MIKMDWTQLAYILCTTHGCYLGNIHIMFKWFLFPDTSILKIINTHPTWQGLWTSKHTFSHTCTLMHTHNHSLTHTHIKARPLIRQEEFFCWSQFVKNSTSLCSGAGRHLHGHICNVVITLHSAVMSWCRQSDCGRVPEINYCRCTSQGCQVGLFEAKYEKFGLFFKRLASKLLRIYYVVGLFFKSRLI